MSKCALSWQNSLILCNYEELENIYTVYMWELNNVNFCTRVVHKYIKESTDDA